MTVKKAIETANKKGQKSIVDEMKSKLRLYEKGLPYREKNNP